MVLRVTAVCFRQRQPTRQIVNISLHFVEVLDARVVGRHEGLFTVYACRGRHSTVIHCFDSGGHRLLAIRRTVDLGAKSRTLLQEERVALSFCEAPVALDVLRVIFPLVVVSYIFAYISAVVLASLT